MDLHCDPHPMMEHRVVVAAGGSLAAHVHIRDADEVGEARFDPPEIRVAPGATVTYHNHGNVAHTASEKTDAMEHGGSASAPYGI